MRSSIDPNKRVNVILVKDIQEGIEEDGHPIIIKAGERVMRTTASYAKRLVESGFWAYTSKSKLKAFLNKNGKLTRNMRTLDYLQEVSGETFKEQRLGKKVVAVVPNVRISSNIPKVTVIKTIHKLVKIGTRGYDKKADRPLTFRKSDKRRFQRVFEEKKFTYKANKATLALRPDKVKNENKVSGTGQKLIILAY